MRISNAKSVPTVVRSEEIRPWPNPAENEFPPDTRVIWAYWDSGETHLKPFFKLCVASWRAKNPKWQIVILSDDNFKRYVSQDQIPSTFFSLKRQHRSDILRLAVLLRYGGVYMDISTLCLKGFDGLFDNPETPRLLITAPFRISQRIQLVNNSILISPTAKNPVLATWHTAILQYHETPAKTAEEMMDRSEFETVRDEVFKDPWIQRGVFRIMTLYMSNLYLLMNLLLSNMRKYASEHVAVLPTDRWTFDSFVLQPEENYNHSIFSVLFVCRMIWNSQRICFRNDMDVAEEICHRACVIKSSSDLCWQASWSAEDLLPLETTYGRILRYALDETNVEQATLEGVTTFGGGEPVRADQ